ncbi:MAG: 2-dehydropantoate 2-reductase [Actinomycetia bacterium]|nr:2-dehydropantoate 2-reductase [Actinomycetes bacterium]
MKIAIVGTGAMGSVYAALLADAGHEVWAIDTWAEHVAAMAEQGLRVEGASGDRVVTTINATADAAEAGNCDLYVIATKAGGVGAAARSIVPIMSSDSLVLTIQNGLGAAERIGEHMPTDNVLLGVAEGFGASMRGPGHAHHNAMRMIRVGEMEGGMTTRLQDLVRVWQEAGFDARAFDDIEQLIWEKFLCNVALSAPCTTFRCTVGDLMANEEWWSVALGCMLEAHQVGVARGVNFSFEDPVAYVTKFAGTMPNARPSMLLDHLEQQPSEIDAINGQVPGLGRQLGIDTPYNDTVCAVVRSYEERFGTEHRRAASGPSRR